MEPTENYNRAFAKMHMYKIPCARQCITLSYRNQLIHRSVFTDLPTPTRHFFPESQRKFLSCHTLNCRYDPCRVWRGMDFGILSPLHPPFGTSSYITCGPSWFELGVWPSPQLAAGKVSLVSSMLSPTLQTSLGHNPINGVFGWCSQGKIPFMECALSSSQQLQSSPVDTERDIK